MAVGGNNSGGSSSGIKAGAAYVTLGVQNNITRDLNQVGKAFQNFGNSIGSIGRKMTLGGVAALTPLVGAMSSLNDIAKQGSIANALGLTSEQFTGMAGAAKAVGNNTREFIESLVTLGKLGTDAVGNIGTVAAPAFKTLGLNAEEFIKLRTDEQFFQMFAAIKKVEDPLSRVRMLMLAFGEDGGKLLLPLLDKSNEELRKFAEGFAVSSDDMAKAKQAALSYVAATSALGKAWQSVSIAAAPIVKILAEGIAQAVTPFKDFVNANREAVVGLALAAGGITTIGLGLMVLGPAITAVGMGLSGIAAIGTTAFAAMGTAVAILTSPLGAVVAATTLISSEFVNFGKVGRDTISGVSGFIESNFRPTIDNVVSSWKEVVSAIGDGDLESAFEIASASLEIEWVRLTTFMEKNWNDFTSTVADSFDSAVIEVEELWADFCELRFIRILTGAAEGLWSFTDDAVDAFEWLSETLTEIWQFFADGWNAIFEGIASVFDNRFGRMIKAAAEGLEYLVDLAGSLFDVFEMFDDAVNLWNGEDNPVGLMQAPAQLIQDRAAQIWNIEAVPPDVQDEAGRLIQETPNERAARMAQERWQTARDNREGRRNAAWDFGYAGDDFGAGFNAPGVGEKIAELATRSMGGFGGSANVGMFGGGGDVGKQIAANTKRTAAAVEKLSVGRYNEAMGLTVEGGG